MSGFGLKIFLFRVRVEDLMLAMGFPSLSHSALLGGSGGLGKQVHKGGNLGLPCV